MFFFLHAVRTRSVSSRFLNRLFDGRITLMESWITLDKVCIGSLTQTISEAMTGIPGSQALASGAKALSKGANKLDKIRDRTAQKIEDVRDRAVMEKDNLRKKIDRENQKMKEGASELFV